VSFKVRPAGVPAIEDIGLASGAANTPALVIIESEVHHNLQMTIRAAGGAPRLMPHVKTHRAPWIVELAVEAGVTAFKCATLAEAAMIAEAPGVTAVTWAYATSNHVGIAQFVALAKLRPSIRFTGLVGHPTQLGLWQSVADMPRNIDLWIDIDSGLGRTGIPLDQTDALLTLGSAVGNVLRGWHVYDGHVKGPLDERKIQVAHTAETMRAFLTKATSIGQPTEVLAGGSYTFDLWPSDVAQAVSPGSWTFSSSQHDRELAHLEWHPAAFVLTTVVSRHNEFVTLDAGAKAISPDKPLQGRFRWDGKILMMNEEHTVLVSSELEVGDQILLMPEHACTTAYLYQRAHVRSRSGIWEERNQLGATR
jgi:D-serine deaminase-like pyridoxal phosphate-dependent protein